MSRRVTRSQKSQEKRDSEGVTSGSESDTGAKVQDIQDETTNVERLVDVGETTVVAKPTKNKNKNKKSS